MAAPTKATITGWPNALFSGLDSEATRPDDMPLDNLGNGEPSEPARLLSVKPHETYVEGDLFLRNLRGVSIDGVPVQGIQLIGHNLTPDDTLENPLPGLWRVLLMAAGATEPDPPLLTFPTGEAGKSNFTGTWADVDVDPFVGGGTGLTCTTPGSNQAIRLLFGTTLPADHGTASPAFGISALQRFYIRIKRGTGCAGSPTTLTFELYQNGVLVDALTPSREPIDSTEEQLIELGFDGVGISNYTQLEIRIAATNGVDEGIDILRAGFVSRYGSGLSGVTDTGLMEAWADAPNALWGNLPPGYIADVAQRDSCKYLENIVVAEGGFQLELIDFENLDGYLDLGELFMGPIFTFDVEREWGELVDLDDLSTTNESHGGQKGGSAGPVRRKTSIEWKHLTVAAAATLMERKRRAGVHTPCFVDLQPTNEVEGKLFRMFATADTLGSVSTGHTVGRREAGTDFTEKL